ncbi:MAG: hypothetical protein FWG38_03640 [Defluviitaleaceae bacterium]|nr:hypothetical protein [Defluviitaleaceae bacterium]
MEKLFVKKKIGVGYTINTKARGGMAIVIALVIVVAAFLFVTLSGITNSVSLEINGNEARVSTSGFLGRSYTFGVQDIESVTLLDRLPQTGRRSGMSNGAVLSGQFDMDGYGRSRVYVNRGVSPYIMVELANGRVFLNGRTPEDTMRYYAQLAR